MKMTPWFPGDVRSVRVGVYERLYNPDWARFCHWNGVFWSVCGLTARIADLVAGTESHVQNLPWRGLAEEPKP